MDQRILFVDDDINALNSLERVFTNQGFQVSKAMTIESAFQMLEENAFDLLLTDVLIDKQSGLDLLRRVKKEYPLTIRGIISDVWDNKKMFSSLDDNIARLYLSKPWDDVKIVQSVERIFELENKLSDKKLLGVMNNLKELPTIPGLYTKITRMIEEQASIEEISKLLEEDQSISSRILRIANSAFYGAKTGSISQAIMYIGLTNVRNIVLTNGVFSTATKESAHLKEIWNHVKLTNKYMSIIYQQCLHKRLPINYASAGLLHDIGRVVIIQYFNKEYHKIIEAGAKNRVSISELESEILGVNHELIGGYLLNSWGIPLPIVESALYHHTPADESIINKELVAVVHMASYYAWKKLGSKVFKEELNLDLIDELAIDTENLVKELQNVPLDLE